MKKLLIHAWVVHKSGEQYFIPYTHWIYLQEIVLHYSEICLISPVNTHNTGDTDGKLFPLAAMPSVTVHQLPYGGDSYASSIKYFFSYYQAYRVLHKQYEKVYVRYPVPFGWLSMLFFKATDRTIHFVGYPLEVANLNPNFGSFKKKLLVSLFKPEHNMYIRACRGARVFTNGHHIKDKLQQQGIAATAVTSSTLIESDFYFDEHRHINPPAVKLLHIGQLRKWKKIDVIIKAFKEVAAIYPGATLTVVGDGESREGLIKLAAEMNLSDKVSFPGHAAKREDLVAYLRSHDIFCFSSVSEGSPRVILEAMANGINVVSTPVGSLPFIFADNEDIVFAAFNDELDFKEKIIQLMNNDAGAFKIRKRAFEKAKGFTIKSFIQIIFKQD